MSEVQTPEVFDPNKEAFTRLGITKDEVEALKNNFGRLELVHINGAPYLYRPLFRREFRRLRDPNNIQGANEMMIEEKVVCSCVVRPQLTEEGLSQLGAGLSSTLAALIYNISDFDIDAAPIRL
jgi:hypothetical protein